MRFFPMIRAGKPTVLMSCLMSIPLIGFALMARFADMIVAISVMGMFYFLSPVLLLIAGLWGGALSMGVGLLSAVISMFLCFDAAGAAVAALYLVPFTVAFVILVEKQKPFIKTLAMLMGTLLLSQVAAYMLIKGMVGGNLPVAAGEGFKAMIEQSPSKDALLFSLYQAGQIRIKDELLSSYFMVAGGQVIGLTNMGRNEMLLAAASMVESMMYSLPSIMISNSILYSTAGLGLSLYIGRISQQRRSYRNARREEVAQTMRRRREAAEHGEEAPKDALEDLKDFRARLEKAESETPANFPDLKMPEFSKWHLPRGMGLKVGLLALGYFPLMLSDSLAAMTVGQMMIAVFSSVYTIQGMAALNYLQKKAGVRPGGRKATLIIIYVIFKELFLWIGVLEQVMNFRTLRPPLGKQQNGED